MNFLAATASWSNGRLRVRHPAFELTAEAPATRAALAEGASCWIGIRPEDVHVQVDGGDGLPATVYVTEPLGGETVIDLQLGDRVVKAIGPPTLQLRADQAVGARLDPSRLHVFTDEGEAVLSAAGTELFQLSVTH